MTLAEEIAALHREHPDWPAIQIAAHIGTSLNTVRVVASRNGIKLPAARDVGVNSKHVYIRARYAGYEPGSRW
jgi:hypothetical protein